MGPELLKLLPRVLAAKAAGTPLRIRGGRTKDFYGESLVGEPLEVGGYSGIVDYEPSELVICARCGTPLAEIEATLAERGQFLGFEPPRFGRGPGPAGIHAAAGGSATIGGTI